MKKGGVYYDLIEHEKVNTHLGNELEQYKGVLRQTNMCLLKVNFCLTLHISHTQVSLGLMFYSINLDRLDKSPNLVALYQ